MKNSKFTTTSILQLTALLSILNLTSSNLLAAKGGNGGGGNPGGGSFQLVYFNVLIEEFDIFGEPILGGDRVFQWTSCDVTGDVSADYPSDHIVVKTGTRWTDVGKLPNMDFIDPDVDICFPGLLDGSYLTGGITSIAREDDPATAGIEEVRIKVALNYAYSKKGGSQAYVLNVRALPLEPSGLWAPLDLEVGEVAYLQLFDWVIESPSNARRACRLTGAFDGMTIVSVTRRAGPLEPGECN